jgi:hypothetical protein
VDFYAWSFINPQAYEDGLLHIRRLGEAPQEQQLQQQQQQVRVPGNFFKHL